MTTTTVPELDQAIINADSWLTHFIVSNADIIRIILETLPPFYQY